MANEELKHSLAELIQELTGTLQTGKEFVGNQAPDVLHQIIEWHIFMGFIGTGIIVFLLLTWAIGLRATYLMVDEDDRAAITSAVALVSGIVLVFTISGIAAATVIDALQAWLTPKYFLLEYARTFV